MFENINWVDGFIIPIIQLVFIMGIVLVIAYYVIKAFHNAYTKSFKFIVKYSILRKPYPQKTLEWVIKCIDEGIGYYEAKKLLYLKMPMENKSNMNMINETLWIYDQILNELNNEIKQKGGVKYDRNSKRCNSEDKDATGTGKGELPTI